MTSRTELHDLVLTLGHEDNVAAHIRRAVDDIGSQNKLAKLTREAEGRGQGQAIGQSALSKLYRGEAGRHVSVNQVIALSAALGIPVAELLLPPSVADQREGWELLGRAVDLRNELRNIGLQYEEVLYSLRRRVARSPELRTRITEHLENLEQDFEAAMHKQAAGDDDQLEVEDLERNMPPAVLAARDALKEEDQR